MTTTATNNTEAETMTYAEHATNEQAIADAWLAENAEAMREEATDTRLEFGAEYFDAASQDIDLDGMDYYTRLGQASVSEARHTVYSVAPEFTGVARAVGSETETFAGHHYLAVKPQPATEGDATVLPYRGEPRTIRKPSAGRNNSHQINTAEQHRIRQLANKDAQKARRFAKKNQVSLSAAMDALGM